MQLINHLTSTLPMAALSFMFLLDRLAHWEPEEETARGRGGFVKRIDFSYHEMGVLDEGNYKTHVDNPNALPVIQGINYRDVVTNNVLMVARLEGIEGDPFTRIWISNVTIGMTAKAKNVPWTCTDNDGITSGVSPWPCGLLPDQGPEKPMACDFSAEPLSIDQVILVVTVFRLGLEIGLRLRKMD